MTRYRVVGDDSLCVASQQCSALAPEVFGHDEDGLVVVINVTPDDALRESAEYAVRICPAQALRLIAG